MTAQTPDILIYEGERLSLFSNPLEAYYRNEGNPRPPFRSPHTGNWRGYVATWEIDSNTLYLTDITAWLADPSSPRGMTEAGLDDLFPGHSDRVEASWFSGQLRVPQGERLQYVHMGYGSVYEQDLILTIQDGKVVHREIVDNREK